MNGSVSFSERHAHLAKQFTAQSRGSVMVTSMPKGVIADFAVFAQGGSRPTRVFWASESEMLDPATPVRLSEIAGTAPPPPPAGAVAALAAAVVILTRNSITTTVFEDIQTEVHCAAAAANLPAPRVVPVAVRRARACLSHAGSHQGVRPQGITDVFEELRRLARGPSSKAGSRATAVAGKPGSDLDRRWLTALQEIEGLGPAGAQQLSRQWASAAELARADLAELRRVMGEDDGWRVFRFLNSDPRQSTSPPPPKKVRVAETS